MLFSTSRLQGFAIAARDGEIGHVRRALFDDERWAIRHLVVRTGTWLSHRDVLVSPFAVQRIEVDEQKLAVSLTRGQVERAPDIDTDKPVSRQQEALYHDYYGYPYYWAGAGMWGPVAFPVGYVPGALPPGGVQPQGQPQQQEPHGDPHLRSTTEVTGYHIDAKDGSIGHVEDFLFDMHSWAILHIVVDTRNWLPGRKVLVDPREIESIDWATGKVRVRLTRGDVKASDEYRPEEMLGAHAGHA